MSAAVVSRIASELKSKPGALLPILHAVQEELGYIPEDAVPILAQELNLTRAEVHVIVTEGLANDAYAYERCDRQEYDAWKAFVAQPKYSPEEVEKITGVPANTIREAARLYARPGNSAIYYGLGVTEHSQGSTMWVVRPTETNQCCIWTAKKYKSGSR